MLAVETQRVMGLRMMKLSAGGPAAHAETLRMISEKGTALTEATLTLARGGSPELTFKTGDRVNCCFTTPLSLGRCRKGQS